MSGMEKGGTELKWQEFADDYLQKPFTIAGLIAAVQQLLQRAPRG